MNILGTIILTAFLLSVLFAGISYGFFLASSRSARNKKAAPAPFSTGSLLKSFAGSVAAQILVMLTYPFGKRRPVPGRVQRGDAPRVVLVHGLYHNSSAWMLWKRPLKRLGLTDISLFSYPSFCTSKAELHGAFQTFMNTLLSEAPQKNVVLIGHSLGGLLAAYWATSTSRPDRILGVVTLGTPFGGSTLARLAVGTLARELQHPKNCILPPLPETLSHVPGLALISPTDNMVLPPENLRPPSGWEVQSTEPQGHVTMLYSRKTRNRVFTFLKRHTTAAAS